MDKCYLKGPSPIKMKTGLMGALMYIDSNLRILTRHLHSRRLAKGGQGTSSLALLLWAPRLAHRASRQVLLCNVTAIPCQITLPTVPLSTFRGITTALIVQTVQFWTVRTVSPVPSLHTHLLSCPLLSEFLHCSGTSFQSGNLHANT